MFDLQAVVLDIDGTLLNSQNEITPKTSDYLHELQDRGVRLILASGRPTASMLDIASHLHLDRHENYIISYNGAKILRVDTGETLSEKSLDLDLVQRLLTSMQDFEVVPMITQGQQLFTTQAEVLIPSPFEGEDLFNVIEYEAGLGKFEIIEDPDLTNHLTGSVNKIIFTGRPDYLQAHAQAMSKPFNKETQNFFTAPMYYEFTNPQANKGLALHYLLDHIQVAADQTIAFGDSGNDQSLLEASGIGVAMGNAMPEIKAIADAVTDSNDEDGIANYLMQLLDEK